MGRARIFGAALAVAMGLGTASAYAAPSDTGQDHRNPQATLVDVHVFGEADQARGGKPGGGGGGGGGKPAPTTANCSNDGATASANYAFTGWTSAGGVAHLNVATVPASVPGAASSLQAAFAPWAAAGAPAFTVAADGTLTRQEANRQTDLLFGQVSGNAIAVTYTWRWSDGQMESDTVFNSKLAWRDLGADGDGCYEDQPYYDLQSIAAHEFGHIYGLGHPAAGRFETMYKYGYTGETLKRTPGAGDVAGIDLLY